MKYPLFILWRKRSLASFLRQRKGSKKDKNFSQLCAHRKLGKWKQYVCRTVLRRADINMNDFSPALEGFMMH